MVLSHKKRSCTVKKKTIIFEAHQGQRQPTNSNNNNRSNNTAAEFDDLFTIVFFCAASSLLVVIVGRCLRWKRQQENQEQVRSRYWKYSENKKKRKFVS